jgi:hypothetical protein
MPTSSVTVQFYRRSNWNRALDILHKDKIRAIVAVYLNKSVLKLLPKIRAGGELGERYVSRSSVFQALNCHSDDVFRQNY